MIESSVPNCPNYLFQLTQQDGEELDPDVFTQYPAMLKIFTKDYSKIGMYTIKMTVKFDSDAYLTFEEFEF